MSGGVDYYRSHGHNLWTVHISAVPMVVAHPVMVWVERNFLIGKFAAHVFEIEHGLAV